MLRENLRLLLLALLFCAVAQIGIFGRLLVLNNPGGKLMKCMIPPCHRVYPLLIALGVFALVGVVALKCLANLNAPCVAGPATKNAIILGTIGIAVANVAIDTHYAHPVPHGGVSLHWSMHSDIETSEQALSPLASLVLSITAMGLNVITHRALTDLAEPVKKEEKVS